MNIGTKPWTVGNPPPCAENWTDAEKERCVAAGNSVLEEGGSEQDAIFACIAAAGKSEQKQDGPKVGNIEDLVSTWNEWAGSYDRCVEVLSGKEGISNPRSLCAWMHQEAEGKWPGEKLEKKGSSEIRGREPTDEEVSRILEVIGQKSEETDMDENTTARQTAKVLPFSIVNDQVVFGEPVEGMMKFVPKSAEEGITGEKANAPSWKCGASRDFPVNEERSWDGAAAKDRIFSWAGWDDSPKPAQARRCFLAYDSANPELRGSYKLPFADIVDGNPVAIRAGLGNAASRLPQTDIPESVQRSGQAVIESYKGKYEKELVEGSEKGYAGADTKFKIFDRDGQAMWVAVTSTAFRDREKEIVSRKALDYSIWFSDITGYRGYVNLYHMPHVKLGSCDFQMRVDEVLLEGGKWFDSEYANAVRDWVDNRAGQSGADEAGCSIEFVYNPEDRVKGVYDRVIIFNRAVLKLKHAANPYTWVGSPEQIRRKNMSTVEDVKEILGEKLAEEALAEARETSKEVRETGAEFKGETVESEEPAAGEVPAEEPKAEASGPEEASAPVEMPAPEESEETVVKEVVFSEEGIKVLSEAIAKHLGIAEMKSDMVALAADVKALVASGEAIKAKVKLVPSAIVRDSKMATENPLPDDQIVGAPKEKSEEDEVAEARAKAYEGYVA